MTAKTSGHLCSGEPLTVSGDRQGADSRAGGAALPASFKNRPLWLQHRPGLSRRCLLGPRNHPDPAALGARHRVHSQHRSRDTGHNRRGRSWGARCPGGMARTRESPGLRSTEWDSGPSAAPAVLGWGRGPAAESESESAPAARGAADMDVALETRAAPGEGAGPDAARDTRRVPRVAAREDMGGAPGLGTALGGDRGAGRPAGAHGARDVGTGARMAPDTRRIAGPDGSWGGDMGPHSVSGPGTRLPTRGAEHSSGSSVRWEESARDASAGAPAGGSRARKFLLGTWGRTAESSWKGDPDSSRCCRWARSGGAGCRSCRNPKRLGTARSRCRGAHAGAAGSSCCKRAAAGAEADVWGCSESGTAA